MFADDTCFYAKDEESISIIKEMTEIYASGSGGKANIDKTEILPIGDIGDKVYETTIAGIKVLDPSNPVRLLGIMVGNNIDLSAVWTPILGRVDKLLNVTWKDRHMSLRGKLVVIKHLALPIIMFTAPFIYMPKDIAKKLDTIPRKFIYSGKKNKVAFSTLQLPLEHGGLDVPNIRDLTDAARIRWVKKLVDDQTPVIWRTLATHMLNISCKVMMGTNIFRHPEIKVAHSHNPHLKHWILVLEAWRRLEGQGTTIPKTLDEIRSTHLAEYDQKVGKQLARHGYNTIGDLLTPDSDITRPKYLGRNQLIKNPKHNLATTGPYNAFIELLPKEAIVPTDFADPVDPNAVYRRIEERENPGETDNGTVKPRKRPRYTKGKTHIPHKPKTKVQRLKVLEDHYVIPSDKPHISVDLNTLQQVDVHNGKLLGKTASRGMATMDKLQLKLDNVMQPLEKYSRMAAYRTTQYANSTSHKHHQKWDSMFPDEYIDWPTLRTHPTNSPNLINLRFSLMHGAIRIGSQARHWMKDADLSCPSCKQKCNDVHLFLECPTSVQAWKHVEDFWASLQNKLPILGKYQVKQSYKLFGPPMVTTKNSIEHNIYSLLDSFIGHMQTAIWNAYCSRVHSSIEYTASTIIEIYNNKISRSLQHFLHSMKQNSYVPSRWGCPKLTLEQIAKISTQPNWKNAYTSLLRAAVPTAIREPATETPRNATTMEKKKTKDPTRQMSK